MTLWSTRKHVLSPESRALRGPRPDARGHGRARSCQMSPRCPTPDSLPRARNPSEKNVSWIVCRRHKRRKPLPRRKMSVWAVCGRHSASSPWPRCSPRLCRSAPIRRLPSSGRAHPRNSTIWIANRRSPRSARPSLRIRRTRPRTWPRQHVVAQHHLSSRQHDRRRLPWQGDAAEHETTAAPAGRRRRIHSAIDKALSLARERLAVNGDDPDA